MSDQELDELTRTRKRAHQMTGLRLPYFGALRRSSSSRSTHYAPQKTTRSRSNWTTLGIRQYYRAGV